jgi:hypothetical protein
MCKTILFDRHKHIYYDQYYDQYDQYYQYDKEEIKAVKKMKQFTLSPIFRPSDGPRSKARLRPDTYGQATTMRCCAPAAAIIILYSMWNMACFARAAACRRRHLSSRRRSSRTTAHCVTSWCLFHGSRHAGSIRGRVF